MRIRIHDDIAKLVNRNRRKNKRSANQEVNMALVSHYSWTLKAHVAELGKWMKADDK